MKQIIIDMDCGALGDQDLAVGYMGNLMSGIYVKSVKIMGKNDELIGQIMGDFLDQIEQAAAEKLHELRKQPKNWDDAIKTEKEKN